MQSRYGQMVMFFLCGAMSLMIASSGVYSDEQASSTFLFMSFNVEQLYDNIDDPNTLDERFLPNSNPPYTDNRVQLKLNNIADVILSANNSSYYGEGPDVVSVLEVENLAILKELAKVLNARISKAKYQAVYLPGVDVSGMNPGLLTKFPIQSFKVHKPYAKKGAWYIPSISGIQGKPVYTVTRDILEVRLKVNNHPLVVFVNHWPAKVGSLHILRRYECGRVLHGVISDILTQNPNTDIIVSGDFNAQPEDGSLLVGLNVSEFLERVMASSPEDPILYGSSYDIYNKSLVKKIFYGAMDRFRAKKEKADVWDLTILKPLEKYYSDVVRIQEMLDKFVSTNQSFEYRKFKSLQKKLINDILEKRGTFYYYRDRIWNTLDSIQLTKSMFNNKGIDYIKNSFQVYKPDFMMNIDRKPIAFHKCKRSGYAGTSGPCLKEDGQIIPQDGYSDHFPVLAKFTISK